MSVMEAAAVAAAVEFITAMDEGDTTGTPTTVKVMAIQTLIAMVVVVTHDENRVCPRLGAHTAVL